MSEQESQPVGVVLGTEPSTPLKWWIAIRPQAYVQLDDVVLVRTQVPGVGEVRLSGVVEMVRSQHEGSRFESDVFLSEAGVLPLQVASSARVVTTRVEPEIWVPPSPGEEVVRVRGEERDEALHFDSMEKTLVAGQSRDRLPVYLDLSFLDGQRGAHVNISGVSGVATKTTYASFLLYTLFHSDVLGREAANTKALVFNVKGEDLLFLDQPNHEDWTTPRASGTERWVSSPVHSARWGSGPRPDGRAASPYRIPAVDRKGSGRISGPCAMSSGASCSGSCLRKPEMNGARSPIS